MHLKRPIIIAVAAAVAAAVIIPVSAVTIASKANDGGGNRLMPVLTAARTAAKTASVKTSAIKKAPAGSTPTVLQLDVHDFTLGTNETYTLTAETDVVKLPAGTSLQFTSNNPQVAEVTKEGVIQAHNSGDATITCRFGKLADSCTVTVAPAATSLTMNCDSVTLGVGETFTAVGSPGGGEAAYYKEYTSDNPSVASVEKGTGIVTAVGEGEATVTCETKNGVKASCKIIVKPIANTVTLNATELEMEGGSTFALEVKLPDGTAAYNRTFLCEDPSVVSVNQTDGVVTALHAGKTRVFCQLANGASAAVTVTVEGDAPLREAMVEHLRSQIGKHNVFFIDYINEHSDLEVEDDFPWCAVFGWSNLDMFSTSMGRQNPIEPCFYVSDIAMQSDALGALHNVNDHDYNPQPGDLFTTCCVDYPGDDGRDHIGYVESVETDSNGNVVKIYTIEGNFAWETEDSDTTKVWRSEWVLGEKDEYGSSVCEFIDLEKLFAS